MITKTIESLEKQIESLRNLITTLNDLHFDHEDLYKDYCYMKHLLLEALNTYKKDNIDTEDKKFLDGVDKKLTELQTKINSQVKEFFSKEEVVKKITPLLNLFAMNEQFKNVDNKK